jgi:hypothetical protein
MTREPARGDKVMYNGRKGVVDAIHFNRHGMRICEISYDEGTPYYEEVYSDHLVILDNETPPPFKFSKKKSWVDSNKACPICEIPWTVTKFERQIWYDCKKCNKTKEQIMKED